MSRTSGKVMQVGRAAVFGIALAVAVAATVAIFGMMLGGRAGTAAARDVSGLERSANGQVANAGSQRLAGEVYNRTELYFGSERPGPDVTRRQFDRFLDREVTPRFPDGLTLLTGYGQFRGSNGRIVQERSFVLILLYPPSNRRANREIQEIRTEYKRAFDQESVLRVDSRERVSF